MTRSLWPLTVPVVIVLTAFSGCGDDEGTPRSDTASSVTGSGGSGGVVDPDAGQVTANFGRACERSEDCGVDLLCLTSGSKALSKGGPPGGLCTVACNQDPAICSTYADAARCVDFGSTSYCLEACDYGSSVAGAFDAAKCHGRTEFACQPSWADTGKACVGVEDCETGERCDGTCIRDLPTCMPRCNGDSDCGGGLFCDPRSGECVDDVPRGRRLTERCNVATEADQCRGSCGLIERAEGGRCDETCTLGAYPSCGVVPDPPTVGCAIPVNEKASFGDLGYCALLCDCTEDCPDQMVCVVAELAYLQRPGFCKSPEDGDSIRSSCGSGGGGGEAGGTAANGVNGAIGATASTGTSGHGGAPAEGGAAGASEAFGGTAGG